MSLEYEYCFDVYTIDGFKHYLIEKTDIIDFLLSSNISEYEETRISFYEEHESSVKYCARLIDVAERDFAAGYFSPELTEVLKTELPIINQMYTKLIDKTEQLRSLLDDYYEKLLCDDNLIFNKPLDDDD